MGLYFRKRVSLGPFRFNLSGSGVGVSVGAPGFRVGTGPSGNYVHLGRGGVYYRRTLSNPVPVVPDGYTHASLADIESANATEISDSSSEQLLDEIRMKRRRWTFFTPVLVIVTTLLLTALVQAWPGWSLLLLLVFAIAALSAAKSQDNVRKTVVIVYDLDAAAAAAFERFCQWADALAGARRLWHIAASGPVSDPKYHAGAGALVRRSITSLRRAAPPHVKANATVLALGAGKQTLYFMPDRVLIYDGVGVGAVSYRTLQVSAAEKRFIEEEGVPSDASVVGHTWRYVNKSGGPDRRFNHNPQLPVCRYDELYLQSPSGLNEVIQISRPGLAGGFAAAVQHLGTVTG